ncbi:MAG: ATP-binding protein [Runella sp.]
MSFTYIPRQLLSVLRERLIESSKIIVLYGARQVGKTTLIRQVLADLPYKTLSINADEKRYTDVLSSRDFAQMQRLVGGYELLFIDEAQRIPDVGINLKILHDALPALKIIVTGSSAFELSNRTQEPLTGRTWTYRLFPIAYTELRLLYNPFQLDAQLEALLLYGSYPEALNLPNQTDKVQFLHELSTAYLYKDVLEIASIKHTHKLQQLLRLLAFQVGTQVSLNELGNALQMSKDTVAHYIDLLEKSFVVFRLSGFSRNLRKEVVKMDKIYFYDLGVRNALINNFNPLTLRNDVGALWENFLISERRKHNAYQNRFVNTYFWRTYTGAEIDYLEEANGMLAGFEFKYSDKSPKAPDSWLKTYPEATFKGIHRGNYDTFLG